MYLHKEGKVAEYQHVDTDEDVLWRVSGPSGFDLNISMYDDSLKTKEEAYLTAMDYHETEGCALYLELYPAPEKGRWKWIAQDYDGEWVGFNTKPRAGHVIWVVYPEPVVAMHNHISQSPPNPFWRKTLR